MQTARTSARPTLAGSRDLGEGGENGCRSESSNIQPLWRAFGAEFVVFQKWRSEGTICRRKYHQGAVAKEVGSTEVKEDDSAMEMTALREELERHMASGTPLEIIYFGGGLPGQLRSITPLHYCEKRGRGHLIGLCHRSGIEKTFRLDRIHLPGPPFINLDR